MSGTAQLEVVPARADGSQFGNPETGSDVGNRRTGAGRAHRRPRPWWRWGQVEWVAFGGTLPVALLAAVLVGSAVTAPERRPVPFRPIVPPATTVTATSVVVTSAPAAAERAERPAPVRSAPQRTLPLPASPLATLTRSPTGAPTSAAPSSSASSEVPEPEGGQTSPTPPIGPADPPAKGPASPDGRR